MFFQRFDRHARLMSSMADALGHDLETEMLTGRLSPEDYRDKVLRCVGCRNAEGCAQLLATSKGFLDAAPGYCRNKDALDAMAR